VHPNYILNTLLKRKKTAAAFDRTAPIFIAAA
jgi:hypothetical protein